MEQVLEQVVEVTAEEDTVVALSLEQLAQVGGGAQGLAIV